MIYPSDPETRLGRQSGPGPHSHAAQLAMLLLASFSEPGPQLEKTKPNKQTKKKQQQQKGNNKSYLRMTV